MRIKRKRKVDTNKTFKGKKVAVNYYTASKDQAKKNLNKGLRKYNPKEHNLSSLGLAFLDCLNAYEKNEATNKLRKNWALNNWGATMLSVITRWDGPVPEGLSTDPNDLKAQVEIYSNPLIKPLPKIAHILTYIENPIESSRQTLTKSGKLKTIFVPSPPGRALDYLAEEIRKLIHQKRIVLYDFDRHFIHQATHIAAEPWLIAAQLIEEIKKEPERLKRCRFCSRFFWDVIKNKTKTHCGRIRCIRDQKIKSVENSPSRKKKNNKTRSK